MQYKEAHSRYSFCTVIADSDNTQTNLQLHDNVSLHPSITLFPYGITQRLSSARCSIIWSRQSLLVPRLSVATTGLRTPGASIDDVALVDSLVIVSRCHLSALNGGQTDQRAELT